ncbi:arf-GAP with GTPase, ANK repeat and PH domain-containing protein 3-like [Dipodomys spectabilis]|uniref:arf-GAP with GTPase, ANK repeat and PH domain-containing protein 3-like n=1 Tax=Dipodomys spectabilis TaxID=105255 RepID=UPI001C537B1E|nr:arf-GAP with GTPase, ANK repeat and PH domain-containing protein 3-like [Dipodomys spectabilis]
MWYPLVLCEVGVAAISLLEEPHMRSPWHLGSSSAPVDSMRWDRSAAGFLHNRNIYKGMEVQGDENNLLLYASRLIKSAWGPHQHLGAHLSRVRSLDLNDWPPKLLAIMTAMGNTLANSIWEGALDGYAKLGLEACREEKEHWIRVRAEALPAPLPSFVVPLGQQLLWAMVEDDLWLLVMLQVHGSKEEVNGTYGDGDAWTALHLSSTMANKNWHL